ncbi:hypothetical protein Tco_0215940 [Tanacetum coccineum]
MKENEVNSIKKIGKQLNEEILHEHEIDKSFKLQSKDVQSNPVQAVDANLVVMESSGIELENNNSENALSKLVNETQMTEIDKQHTSSRSGNDTTHVVDADIRLVNDQEPLAEVDSNITLDLTNMSNNGGKTDHDAEQYHVKSPLSVSLIDQPITD